MRILPMCLLWFAAGACSGDTSVPIRLAGKPAVLSVPLSAAAIPAARQFELSVNGIEAAPGQAVILRIFAGAPEANRDTSVDNANFVGYVTLLPTAAAKRAPVNTILSMTEAQTSRVKPGRVEITIVPMNDTAVRIGSVGVTPLK